MRTLFLLPAALAAAMLGGAPALAAPTDDIVGEYELVSSTTVPASDWGFSKARYSIRKLDERHLSLVLACQWKDSPKSVCSERYVAQRRNGGLYVQDRNTSHWRMDVDPRTRKLAIVTEGADGTVRRDVYTPTQAPLTDKALVRRMKRERDMVDDLVDEPAFGHFSKWDYRENRIGFRKID
jgi:hypothetical protein